MAFQRFLSAVTKQPEHNWKVTMGSTTVEIMAFFIETPCAEGDSNFAHWGMSAEHKSKRKLPHSPAVVVVAVCDMYKPSTGKVDCLSTLCATRWKISLSHRKAPRRYENKTDTWNMSCFLEESACFILNPNCMVRRTKTAGKQRVFVGFDMRLSKLKVKRLWKWERERKKVTKTRRQSGNSARRIWLRWGGWLWKTCECLLWNIFGQNIVSQSATNTRSWKKLLTKCHILCQFSVLLAPVHTSWQFSLH